MLDDEIIFLMLCMPVIFSTLKSLHFAVEIEKLMKEDVSTTIPPVIWTDQILSKI